MAVMIAATILRGMAERPHFVHRATTEGEREVSGCVIRSRNSERASAVRFLPGCADVGHSLESAALFVVLLILPLSHSSVRWMGLPAPSFRCGLDLR
jgi:hypothetical protein